ncbi:NAD(P)/FAD-dependent oxidoreductase [Streptomyces physcomitrii]|uniref:Oxidoreductase n=1 Tax=Streptomyces physcomitrii TaxID=2724184 RepID=A0ABX1H341_9ACTN|nr:FAD-dependent oxidoreductase [Streptomyces physcomitrii]NKI42771.1 oxidoreductase [Streptomyces physcomitrii]
MKSVAIVGASLAGLSAARALRKQGYAGRLLIIGEEAHRPYDRPPLSKEFLAGSIDEEALSLEAEDEDLGAQWLLGTRATALDGPSRTLGLDDGSTLRADGIVLATGASARELPGARRLPGVHLLRTLDDARALRRDLRGGGRLVVVGGGFVGAEVASTARGLGMDVTLVQSGPAPLAGVLGTAMGRAVSLLHVDHGVRMLCGTGVQGLTGTDRVSGVVLADGRTVPADIVVLGIGSRPCTDWLHGSSVALGDGVVCTAAGATSVPGVVAVGDCASWYDPLLGTGRRVEHWSGARDRAPAAVATLLSGGTAGGELPRPPYFWSDQYGVRIQFTGHTGPADSVAIEEGAVDDRSFLAVYRQAGRPVGALGVNRTRSFMRWRRQLAGARVPQQPAVL